MANVRQATISPTLHVKGLKICENKQLALGDKTGSCGTRTWASVHAGLWLLLHMIRHKHIVSVVIWTQIWISSSPKLDHLIKLWLWSNQAREYMSLSLWQWHKMAGNEVVLPWEGHLHTVNLPTPTWDSPGVRSCSGDWGILKAFVI